MDLEGCVRICGKRPEADVFEAFSRAACVATASEREGYGLVVVEAAAHGTPAVIVAGEENAATELVIDGVNGAVARTVTPPDIGGALLRVIESGSALRATTERWFAENAEHLLIERSLELVLAAYGAPSREEEPSLGTPRTASSSGVST
jgi:glycosyltransferase involved in cell wall biosynthesis